MMIKKLSIIIPVFNEEETIEEVVDQIIDVNIKNISKEIIIVDDGSNDKSPELIKKIKNKYKNIIKTIKFLKNMGNGTAIRKGLEYVTGDYTIVQDADIELSPKDYKKMVAPVQENNAKVVFGSRFKDKIKKIPLMNIYANQLLAGWANFFYKTNITDEACGFKLIKTELIKSLDLKCKRWEFCPEVFAKISNRKIKIYEVPVLYYPRKRIKRQNKINYLFDGLHAVFTILYYKITGKIG